MTSPSSSRTLLTQRMFDDDQISIPGLDDCGREAANRRIRKGWAGANTQPTLSRIKLDSRFQMGLVLPSHLVDTLPTAS